MFLQPPVVTRFAAGEMTSASTMMRGLMLVVSWIQCLAVVVLASCDFPRLPKLVGPMVDAMLDAPPDVPLCFGSYVRVCFDSAADVPSAPLILSSDIDTGASLICNTRNDKDNMACVVAAAGLTVPLGTTIRGTGAKPLILLSTTTVDISGKVDVSSSRTGTAGAGASAPEDCMGTTAASNNSGGFGGSFGGMGGEHERRS